MIGFSADALYPAVLAFSRASGLLLLLPVFSGASIPVRMRIALAALLALIATPLIGSVTLPPHWLMLVVALGHESLAGLLMGLAARMLFYAIEMAGQIITSEIGLSLSPSIDPITETTSSPLSTLLFYFGTLLFLLSGAHHWCLLAFVRSFEVFPTNAAFDPATADLVIAQSGRIFLVAVQLAAPLLALNFLINLAFAVLGRAAPSINAFQASFPVRILAGLMLLGLTFGVAAQHMLGELRAAPELMLRFLR